MADVYFKEGTQADYESITPSEDTFYKVTQSSGYDVYLGDVKLNNQADIDEIYKILEEMEDEIKKLDPNYVELKPLADCTPEEIAKIVQSGQAQDVWSIGDSIGIALNGTVGAYTFDNETWYAEIIGFNHNKDLETGGLPSVTFQFGVAEDGTKVAFIDNNYGSAGSSNGFRMNTSNTNSGGWESSYMRSTICPQFLEAMPQEWQDIIKPTIKYTDNVGGASGNTESNVTATEDKIFLLSYHEVGFTSSNANSYEANYTEPYSDRYGSNNNRIRYRHSATGSTCHWWERSVNQSSSNGFCGVTTYGATNYSNAHNSDGFAPAYTIF